jgi:hypothetical protein
VYEDDGFTAALSDRLILHDRLTMWAKGIATHLSSKLAKEKSMKVGITGASVFVNRMYEACGNYQWARELLKNSLEAGAIRVEFGIEWQAVEKIGVYRRTIADDGQGMTAQELREFFATLGLGSKKIGGLHDNFGVGAKIAALPWNPDGLVVLSFKEGAASMIKIVLDPETNEYELVDFVTPDRRTCVIDPTNIVDEDGVNWGAVAPDWVKAHGTVVVLLGSEDYPDTVLGNARADEKYVKGLSVYLNTRFWDLSHVTVQVAELRSDKKNSWPLSPSDRDDARRPNNRRIQGARYYISGVKSDEGKVSASGSMMLDQERVLVDWYLWEGERPNVHMYAKKGGYLAVRYGDELFELSSAKPNFRAFGIIEAKVQQNLTIIVEPQLYEPASAPWGVHPDQSRNRLIFTGNGEKGGPLPMYDWGGEFAENMPEAIRQAIITARGEISGSIEDDEYRRRLQDKFGARWTMRRRVVVPDRSERTREGQAGSETVNLNLLESTGEPLGVKRPKRKKTVEQVRFIGIDGSGANTAEREVPVDVPHFRYASKDEFENELHLAAWVPHDPRGPTVILNQEAPVLLESIKHHQDQYPDIHAEEIAKTVMDAYGEIAASKIAHSQKLTMKISEQELDATYRSEPALTIALMGLLAEEAVISQRLGRFGRKKAA